MRNTQSRISRKIDKALLKFKLVKPGDKVLLGVSGGKDSLTLAYFLSRKALHFPVPFSLECVYVKTDLAPPDQEKKWIHLFEEWDIPLHIVEFSLEDRLKEGKKINCYWCSTQRRMELIKLAESIGASKIALGHHMDDVLETFFMNMVYKKEMSSMLPSLEYDNYPFAVIRPLYYVEEKEIIDFAREKNWSKITCSCNFDTRSNRKKIRGLIEVLGAEHGKAKENVLFSLSNPRLRYLPVENEESV